MIRFSQSKQCFRVSLRNLDCFRSFGRTPPRSQTDAANEVPVSGLSGNASAHQPEHQKSVEYVPDNQLLIYLETVSGSKLAPRDLRKPGVNGSSDFSDAERSCSPIVKSRRSSSSARMFRFPISIHRFHFQFTPVATLSFTNTLQLTEQP